MAQKSTIEAVDIVWKRLDTSVVKADVTGAISKYKRPYQSEKIDVVVNAIGLSGDVIGDGTINVNIHVPNPKITTDGIINYSQPDVTKLRSITRKCIDVLTDVWGDDYNFTVALDGGLIEEDKSSYNNLRIQFNSLNY